MNSAHNKNETNFQRSMKSRQPLYAFLGRCHRSRAVFKLWLYHSASRPGRNDTRLLSLWAGIVYLVMLCLGELSVAMPVTGCLSHLCSQIHRAGDRIYGCLAVLADMDRGIGIRIHSSRPVNAALVSPYIGLDVECRLCAVHFLA